MDDQQFLDFETNYESWRLLFDLVDKLKVLHERKDVNGKLGLPALLQYFVNLWKGADKLFKVPIKTFLQSKELFDEHAAVEWKHRFFPRAFYLQLMKLHCSGFFESFRKHEISKRTFNVPLFWGKGQEFFEDPPNVFPLTGCGMERCNNTQQLCERALTEDIPGDFVETGVWRGGMSLLMRAVLERFGDKERTVWLADSFEGLPIPDPENKLEDQGDHLAGSYSSSVDSVKKNFHDVGLLSRVEFLVGWFCDTLPTCKIGQIAVLRLDGDLYSSTMDALKNLYDKVVVGGFIIIDDFGSFIGCHNATLDFRKERGITDHMYIVERTATWWRKSK